MQVFKTFALITKRNLSSLLMYFGIFMALTILFTQMGKDQEISYFNQTTIPTAVFDDDKSELSKGLYDYLSDSQKIVKISRDKEAIQDELFYRNVEYVLTIPKGYEESFLAGAPKELTVTKIPGSSSGQYIDSQVNHYLKKVSVYLKTNSSMKDALKETKADLKKKTEVALSKKGAKDGAKKGIFYFYLYLEYIFTACMISGLGLILVAFNRKDIRMRAKCASMPLKKRNFQLILGCIGFAGAMWLLYMIAGFLLYRGEFLSRQGLYYMLNSIVLLIVCMALTFLCSQLTKGSDGLSFFSNVFALGFAFLGGVFVQQDLLNNTVLKFSRFLPSYWYVKVHNAIEQAASFTGSSLAPIRNGLLIQLGFAAALFAVGLAITKRTSQTV